MIKLVRGTREYGPAYTFAYFDIHHTDNSSARATGRLPKWTVYNRRAARYGGYPRHFDTLAEVREYIAERLAREAGPCGAKTPPELT